MSRCILLELRSAYSPACACVVACPLRKGGYYISDIQLARAKRKMNVPVWSTVHLLSNPHCTELRVVTERVEDDEVITCAN